MGSQNSSLRKTLEEEFVRLTKGQKFLTIEQLIQIRLPHSPWNLDPTHLGVLWTLDRSKTGLISLEDLVCLAKFAESRIRCYQNYEFQSQMQGYCMLGLWKYMVKDREDHVCEWLENVILNARRTVKFRIGGDELYIHEDVIRSLHLLFRIKEIQGIEFVEFFNVLQEAGEEIGLMDIDDEEQDRWVPFTIVSRLLSASVAGMSKVMEEIFPMDEQNVF